MWRNVSKWNYAIDKDALRGSLMYGGYEDAAISARSFCIIL